MAALVGAMATSHAYTFIDPTRWSERRKLSFANFEKWHKRPAVERTEIAGESLEDNIRRYAAIRHGHELIRETLRQLKPDTLILVGDDQNENITARLLPQFAVYIGAAFTASDRGSGREIVFRNDTTLAATLLHKSVLAEFDLASMDSLPDGKLLSHAHTEPLVHLVGDLNVRVIPVFVNAIHVPGPEPRRCYRFGQVLRAIVEEHDEHRRVVIMASGGLSHFTAGYPYQHCPSERTLGSIYVSFDEQLVHMMRSGDGAALTQLSSRDLLDNGDPEFRQWLVLLGAVGQVTADYLAYEAFYSALMGMGVGCWRLDS